MRIPFNPNFDFVGTYLPTIKPSYRPIVYVISAIAIGILLIQCCRFLYGRSKAESRLEGEEEKDVKILSPKETKHEDLHEKIPSPKDVKKEEKPKVDDKKIVEDKKVEDKKFVPPKEVIKEEPPKVIEKVTLDIAKVDEVSLEEKKNPPSDPNDVLTFNDLVEKSDKFAQEVSFQTRDNLIKNFAITPALQAEVLQHAKSTNPILHPRVWELLPRFIDFKRKFGSPIEKEVFMDLTPHGAVDRWIKKRPIVFMGPTDMYLLRGPKKVDSVKTGGFEHIGTVNETAPLLLKDYQSYFEMQLSALMSVCVPTHFINTGSRNNSGMTTSAEDHEAKGIYFGSVGARFERDGLMESATMLVTRKQNTPENGYGLHADPYHPKTIEMRLWAELFGSKIEGQYVLPSFDDVAKYPERFIKLDTEEYLDTHVFKERMRLVVEAKLVEAKERAEAAGKMGYCHNVGLGLGVWQVDDRQNQLLVDVYAETVRNYDLSHISDLDFSWFKASSCGGVPDKGQLFDAKGHPITIHFSKRNPADKLTGADEGKLLIADYAWDSNSYPGNEYWIGMLTASGDPAAACCSTIPELQNPDINPFVQAKYLKIMG